MTEETFYKNKAPAGMLLVTFIGQHLGLESHALVFSSLTNQENLQQLVYYLYHSSVHGYF